MKKEHVVLISYKYEYEGTYQSLVMTNLVWLTTLLSFPVTPLLY